ncbi:MAG: protein kinase [Chitinophagaceae bacterium]|nr:protein kinase [Anaerolineae bacterium]
MALQIGDEIGPYKITEQLGSGGMATVYKAYHARLDRHVAIKVMHANFLLNDAFLARFEREARIVARLEHPNIVPIYDYSEVEKQPYLVMKFIEGQTLKDRLHQSALDQDEILRLMTAVANALDYAHKQGVLHRDIKPSNIIIDQRGTPYLTDFGLARLVQAGESTMSADVMLGTPHYISPEQASGNTELDARTDIYSLGVVLYELLTGRVPYAGNTPYAIVHDHIYTPVPRPSEVNPGISPQIENVLLKALEKKPADRYATASELLEDLRSAVSGSAQSQTTSPALLESKPKIAAEAPPKRQSAPISKAVPPIPPIPPVNPIDNFAKRMEEFGERMGEMGERFGEQAGEIGERFGDSIGRAFDSDSRQRGRSRNRFQSRDGSKWVKDGPEGDGFYTPAEMIAFEGSLTDEKRIRKQVEKRMEERLGFYTHLAIYLCVNIGLWGIWLFSGTGFPWPMFTTFFWGMGMLGHTADYYNKYGGGRDKREEMIQREIERERRRLSGDTSKAKNEDRAIRLTEDGELTDSFIDEIDNPNKRKNG